MMYASECLRYCSGNRWTDESISAIRGAITSAQLRRCPYVGTDQLLLALVADSMRASTLLNACEPNSIPGIVKHVHELESGCVCALPAPGVSSATNHAIVNESAPGDDLPLSPRTLTAITLATELAITKLTWNHGHVGSEHVLLAFLLDMESVPYQILINIGITFQLLLTTAQRLFGPDPTGPDTRRG